MSDIFKKALADDLKKNFNLKDSEKVLEQSAEKAVEQKIQQPATPKPPAPVFKKPVAPAGTPITEKNMDLFFGASEDPKLSQQNIQSAKAVQPKSAIVNKGVTKKDQAIIKDVNKAFTKPETLPIKPLTAPDLKPGEYIYMDPEEEYSNRKALDKAITEGIKTGVNPVTKAKIDDKQKKELELVQKQLKLQTDAEQIEAGFIGTGDIATLKRTGGESFQQPMMPLKGFEKIDLSLTKDKDVPRAELLALKLSNEEKFNENFFGKDFAKQEKDKKLNQFVWEKSGPKRGSELIDQYKLELKSLEKDLQENQKSIKEIENDDQLQREIDIEVDKNQSFFNTGLKYKDRATARYEIGKKYLNGDYKGLKTENFALRTQIEQKKNLINSPYKKNAAQIGAQSELFNYLDTQEKFTRLEIKTENDKKAFLATEAKKEAELHFTKYGFRLDESKSKYFFKSNVTGNVSVIPKTNVEGVFKSIFEQAYSNISTGTNPKNLKTYAELAAYVERFPNSEFAKRIQKLGEEKGKALGFQGDWLPDFLKKEKGFDYKGNLYMNLNFTDDPIAVYAASINSEDKSNPLLAQWKTKGFGQNFIKEFLVNSSLEADKNYVGGERLNRQIKQDEYILFDKPLLLKQIKEAESEGNLEKVKELNFVLSKREAEYQAREKRNVDQDERDEVLLKSIEARLGTKGELSSDYLAKKDAGMMLYNLAQPTRDLLEFMAPVMIMELATAGLATPAVAAAGIATGAVKTAKTGLTLASKLLKAAPTVYSRYNESKMEVAGAQTAFYDEKLNELLGEYEIDMEKGATFKEKEAALKDKGVTEEQLAAVRLNTTVGANSLFWKNMALAIPDLVQMNFITSTLLNGEKKIAENALKQATREKFLNLTIKGVGVRVPLKQTGKLIGEAYLKSYLPEKFEEGIQFAFGKTYEEGARGYKIPTFFNAMGSFIKDAYDAGTSINFVPGTSFTNFGGVYSDDKEFQMSADIGGFLGGATAGLGVVNSTIQAGFAFNRAFNDLTKLGFYDPNFTVDRITGNTLRELLNSNQLDYHIKLIQDQKAKLQQQGDLNTIYNYSKEDLRSIEDDPELVNLKQLRAELGDRASSELNETVDYLEREHFRNKVYENNLSPVEQYDRFINQLSTAKSIYEASLEKLSGVRSDKFFSTVAGDVKRFADTLTPAEKSRYLKSFGGKTRIKNRLEQTIAEHAMSIARAQTDISHVDNMISQIMSKQNEDNYFNIPGLQQLFYDELLVADKEQALINFEMMLEFNPDLDPALKEKVELIRKNLRKERLRINTEFESIKTNLKEPLEGTPNRASLKEQQQYLDQFVESGKGFTRFNREKIRDNAKIVDPTILELMKEKSRRSDTLEFATEQLTKLSQIKKASQLASWYNDSLTNVEKQLIKNRATRLKELEENRNQLNDVEVEEANELKDALDIPQDASPSEVNKAIGDAISETDATVDPNVATEATLVLSEDFDFTSLSSNPMVKVVLNNYPLANVRGIKTRIKNGESFVITEVNNDAGYFTVTSNDGKANVKIAIKNGPLDGTTTVGKKEDATVQDKLDDLSASTETPTVSTATPLDPTPTEVIVTEDIKNIQNTTIDEITNRLQILNSKKFDVNPQDENTYIEVDENGNPVKDENGNVVSYSRVSTLKGAKEIKDKRPANRGTIIDTLLRDFINNKFPSIESFILAYNSHPLKNLTQKFSPAMLKNLFDIFTEFKKSTDVLGIQLISDIPTLWGKLGGSNFAGTIDLMGIAPDGSVYIIDLKTASKDRRAVYNNNDPSDPYYGFYVEGDSLQQSAYAELLRQRTGITVKNLLILPIQTTLLNNEFSSAKPNISSTGKYTIQVGINRAIFPEINLPIEEKTETNIISPEVAVTTTPTIEVTAPAPVSNIEAKKLKLDPDLAKIDPLITAARNGDIDAQKKLEEYGLEWEQTTTYRFIGQSEVDVLLSNNEVKSKRFVDVGIDVTTSSKVTSAASNDYRVTFKESFDVNNGLGKVNVKSRKEGDHNLEKGKGYSLSDVAKIEKLDENGNVIETIYDAELAVLESTTDTKADIIKEYIKQVFIKSRESGRSGYMKRVREKLSQVKSETLEAGKKYVRVVTDTEGKLEKVEIVIGTGKSYEYRFMSGFTGAGNVKSVETKFPTFIDELGKESNVMSPERLGDFFEIPSDAELEALEGAPTTPTPEPTTKKEGIQVTPAEIGTNTDVVVVDAHFERPDVFGEFTNSEIASGTSNPLAVAKETQDIYELGQKLDMNDSEWVIGSLRAQVDGRLIVDVFAEGKRFLMYRSIGEGTGIESRGEWVPMFSFAQNGWFVKGMWKGENPKFNKYESKTFKAIHNYLTKNTDVLFTGAPTTAENQDIIIDEKYLGKLIYSSSTSGKSTLAKNSQNVIDADDLLKEAILEVEPSGQVSIKEIYGLSIFDKVKSVFFKKIKSALAQNKTVVSANRIVREALPSELTIDYVFLHSDPSEFVKRSVDRPEPFTERSAKGLFESEKNRFKQANFYYPSGVTISDVIKAGSTVELVSIPSVEETSTKDAPIRKRVDSRLSIPYTFYNMIGVRNNVANRDAAIDKRNNFINSTEEQQMNFSVVSTPVNPTMLQKFVDMGLNISKNSIPVEMLFDKNFNPNDLTLEQIAALKNGQPILVAVNNIVTNTIKLGDTTHPLELGSPYRLVLVTPSAPATTEVLSSGDEGSFINNANLSVKFFNPNDYSLDQLSSLLKFNNKSALATQSEIQAFVKRFNDSVKLYKVLATLPANTPITLANIKDIVTISSTVGEMNLVKDGRFSITELPQSMLYPFGEQAGIIIVDNTRSGRIIQVDKNNISVIQARQLNTMDLGSTFGLKLIIKHPRLDKILYVDIDMPSVKQDQEVAAINLATVLSEQINKIQAKGIDPQINVSTYNAKLENTFGREGLINITSPSLQGKGVFFNLKLKKQSDNTAEFILEVKRKVDGKYVSSIIPVEKLLQENPASTNDFIKFLYDNINIPEIKNLFENPNNDFTIGFGGTNIDAIINNATTRLSPTEPFTNSTITATLVNDIESKTLANLSNIKETAVSSLDDFTTDPESGEIDYLAEFETLYNSSKIAITQMLKVRGVKLDTLKNFIKENKIVVNEIDQINDILTKMC